MNSKLLSFMMNKLSILSSSLYLSLLSSFTWAETSTEVLQTIQLQAETVGENLQQSTAMTKFSHDILDVPFSRSVLSKALIQQQDVQRIDDALTQVSGVYSQTNYGGGFWDNFSFRGFSTDPNIGAQIIRNGLSVNRGLSAPRDMVNIESLDFLKGPMGPRGSWRSTEYQH